MDNLMHEHAEADELERTPDGASLSTSCMSPFAVIRAGGIPARSLDVAGTHRTAEMLERIASMVKDLEERREPLCDALAAIVPGIDDAAVIRTLLDLKRDIYNCRARGIPERLLPHLPDDLRERAMAFLEQAGGIEALRNDLGAAYKADIAASRKVLRAAWQEPNLRNGILHSNRILHGQLSQLFRSDQELPDNKKTANACDSLLGYAARSGLKASPLSSFTLIHLGRWTEEGQDPADLHLDAMPVTAGIEIKQSAVLHALEPILSKLDILGLDFPLILNPTARLRDGALHFEQVNRSAYVHPRLWGNNGVAATMELNAGVKLAISIFRKRDNRQATAAELLRDLAPAVPDGAYARALLDKLVALQLLVPVFDRFEQEPLLPWLAETLSRMNRARTAPLVAIVEGLSEAISRYRQADETSRSLVADEIDAGMQALIQETGADLPKHVLMPLVYEDCFVDASALRLGKGEAKALIEDLRRLLDLAPALDFNHVLQSLIAERFIDQFGPDGECGDVRAFLAEITQEFFGAESELDLGRMKNLHELQMKSDIGVVLSQARKEYFQHIYRSLSGGSDIIRLDRDVLAQIAADLPASVNARTLSQCFCGQFAKTDEGEEVFVLNHVFPGAANLTSRFFARASDAEVADLRTYLEQLAPTGKIVEIASVFGFNANMHPRLADDEIVLPGHKRGFPDANVIELDQLTMTYAPEADRIVLRRDGRAFDPFYFGFLSPSLLPRSIRPLSITSTQNLIHYAAHEREILSNSDGQTPIVQPRLMFGSVCLARKRIIFSKAMLPDPSLADAEFFAELWHWRQEWSVPSTAYYRFLPDPLGSGGQPPSAREVLIALMERQRQFDPTALKPSYIDFDDPQHVRLLRRAMVRNDFDVSVEEALPRPDDHRLTADGKSHVSELQIELSRPGVRLQ